MSVTWYLVLSHESARFIESDPGRGTYRLVEHIKNRSARIRNQALERDQEGLGRIPGPGRDGSFYRFTPRESGKDRLFHKFLKKVGNVLSHGNRNRRFSHCVIVAGKDVLGSMKSELTPELSKNLCKFINKDFGHASMHDLPGLVHHADPGCRMGPRLMS